MTWCRVTPRGRRWRQQRVVAGWSSASAARPDVRRGSAVLRAGRPAAPSPCRAPRRLEPGRPRTVRWGTCAQLRLQGARRHTDHRARDALAVRDRRDWAHDDPNSAENEAGRFEGNAQLRRQLVFARDAAIRAPGSDANPCTIGSAGASATPRGSCTTVDARTLQDRGLLRRGHGISLRCYTNDGSGRPVRVHRSSRARP